MGNMPFCKGTASRTLPVFLLAVVFSIQFILIESNLSQANAAESYQLVTKWGSEGTGDGQFNDPWGIAVDSSGNVYVTDTSNNCIQKFDSSGTFITKWGSSGSGDGQFNELRGVCVDSSGNVYVADHVGLRIQKFSSDGTFITKWGKYGTGDGQFYYPCEIAVDSSGNVYVTEDSNTRVQKFSSSGVFITKWGSRGTGDGQFGSVPTGIAVDSSGNVYVGDDSMPIAYIHKFNSEGTFITKWNLNGFVSYPEGIAVDSSGNIYVADYSGYSVSKFSSSGTFIIEIGSYDDDLKSPRGVCVDSSGNVYVVNSGKNQIRKYSPHTSDATLAFDADSYSLGSYALVTLVDADKNTDSSKVQSLLNSIYIQTSIANITRVMMRETGVNTGTFQGSILVGSDDTTDYFQIKAAAGDILTVTYDELGLTDTATVTSTPVATPTPTPSPTPTPTIGDTTAPTVTITSPTSSSTYKTTSSTIALSGTASDNSGSISSVTWSNSKGENGTARGTTSWSVSNIGLSNGDNTITVTAKDNAGNTATDTITVMYNAATPTPNTTPSPAPTPPPTPSPSPLKEGIVFGFVNDLDEQALEGVSVTIIVADGGTPIQETETDENGYYEFRGLSQGGYILTYEKEGFLAQTHDISLNEGEVKDLPAVKMKQIEKGKIYGYVVNIDGVPLEFVKLKLKGIKTNDIKTASSDADGVFEFTDLDADTYLVFAKKKDYRNSRQKVNLEEGESKALEIMMRKKSKRVKELPLGYEFKGKN